MVLVVHCLWTAQAIGEKRELLKNEGLFGFEN
jgi:hypothetical protein